MPFYNRDVLAPEKPPVVVSEQHRGRDKTGTEFLVTHYSDGTREMAWRGDQWSTWSPPVRLVAVSAGELS